MDANKKRPNIKITPDGLEASMTFQAPQDASDKWSYSVDQLKTFLNEAGVVYGINENILMGLTRMPVYEEEVVVAHGKPAQEGKPGYFEYHFDREFSNKPVIREDGSVDYMNIKVVEVVKEGDLIATYHQAQQGTPGINVKGVVLQPKNVRDLQPLSGRGFERADDDIHYYAVMEGKIEMKGKRVVISPVYEINTDASIATGNINFNGDVIIHGGVSNGVEITATGNITIEGLVETCYLKAGRDIFLLKGVKGNGQTTIEAEGNVTAQFVEYALVQAGGNVQADVFFKSVVSCEGSIWLTGKRASVIGGSMSAIEGIEAYNIGNSIGLRTDVQVGITKEIKEKVNTLQTLIQDISSNVDKIRVGINNFDKMNEAKGVSGKDDPRRVQLLRVKIQEEAVLAEKRMEMERLHNLIAKGKGAKIIVAATIYPGVCLTVGELMTMVKEQQSQVEIAAHPTGICMERLMEDFVE